jgi:hypothetical protein
MKSRRLSEKDFKIVFLFDLLLQSRRVIASQPADDLVNFLFRPLLTFRFLNIERVKPGKFYRENVLFKHGHFSIWLSPVTHSIFSALTSRPPYTKALSWHRAIAPEVIRARRRAICVAALKVGFPVKPQFSSRVERHAIMMALMASIQTGMIKIHNT